MIVSLNIAILVHFRLIGLHWLRKQMQLCQPIRGLCSFPTIDHLLPPGHRAHRTTVAPSRQQNFWEISSSRLRVSKFRAFISVIALGIGFFFVHGSAWGVCAGNTTISTALIAGQPTNNSMLCSYTVDALGSITTNAFGAAPQLSLLFDSYYLLSSYQYS